MSREIALGFPREATRKAGRLWRAAAGSGLAVIIVLGLLWGGQFYLQSMLNDAARSSAELWYHGIRHSTQGDIGKFIERIGEPFERAALRSQGIESIVIIRAGEDPESLLDSGPAQKESLRRTMHAHGQPNGAELMSLPAGSYSIGSLNWLTQPSYETWVLLPPANPDTRLAVRVSQTKAATYLRQSYLHQVLSKTGIGVATFFAFMAGYSYRARQLSKERRELEQESMLDELTGLPNRRNFNILLEKALLHLGKSRARSAVFLLDLDGFKPVNDTLGHPVGDQLLRAVGERLSGALREGDVLARLSGDEFALLVPHVSDVGHVSALAARIHVLISEPFEVNGHHILIGCSIGIAVAPENGKNPEEIVRSADFALYRAKEAGKNTWKFFDPDMAEELERRMTIEEGLRSSIEKDMFTVVYQPQVCLKTQAVVGYEALLRWQLPGHQPLTTSMFLRVAEETGLMIPLGQKVIKQVIQDCSVLGGHCRIAINISAVQLKRRGVAEVIEAALHATKVHPSRIYLEVDSGVLGRDEDAILATLDGVRNLGVMITLDKFDFSSLGLLARFPFDRVKFSGEFLKEVMSNPREMAVARAICSLGQSLNIGIVAQGVESPEVAASLLSLGCIEAQGYAFGQPQPLEELLQRPMEAQRPRVGSVASDLAVVYDVQADKAVSIRNAA